ncbi:MAG: transposase [Myxococcota bacterium]|jgi:transposase
MTGVGIDVSKDTLVVAIPGNPWVGQFANSQQGHEKLVRALLNRCADAQVVVEPTATYHMAIMNLIAQTDGLQVMVANPRQTAAFAKVINQRGKTDNADATMLAIFSQTIEFNTWSPPTEAALRLRDVMRRRLQRVNHQTAEKNRLKELDATGGDPAIR